MHALRCLGEWILVQEPRFSPHLTDPLLPVEDQRATLDLDKQHAPLAVEQHEVALALVDGASSAPGEPVEAVKDLDAMGQLLH